MYNDRKKVHIPFMDVDDLAFKTRQDPGFIASISKANAYLLLFFQNSVHNRLI